MNCPACGAGRPATLLDLDGPRAPRLPVCAACGGALVHLGIRAEPAAFVVAAPASGVGAWADWEAHAERLFWRSLSLAPLAWRRAPEACLRRIVFGQAALDERVRGWAAGLDDALVECLKLDLRLRVPALRRSPDATLRLARATDDHLTFASERGGYRVPRARYAAFAAERAHLAHRWAALFRGPFVDHVRLSG